MAQIPANLRPLFVAAGHQYGIPANVLAGVAKIESAFGANKGPSSAGAVGLMQFMPGTAKGLGINPYDDRQAIFGAAKLLVQYGYHQSPLRALGAYNGGPGNPQYGYAHMVMSASNALKNEFQGAQGMTATAVGRTAQVSTPTFTSAGLSGGQVDTQGAGIKALLSAANRPINTSGKLTEDPVLKNLVGNIASGQFTTPSRANTKTTMSTVSSPNVATKVAQARSGAMPKGVATFGATRVAAWIKPILDYARAHGWTGTLTSGYRSLADQTRIYNSGVRPAAKPGTSNHEFTTFPGGAVDATQAAQLSAILLRSPYAKTLVWAGGKDPVHFSHPHNGSY